MKEAAQTADECKDCVEQRFAEGKLTELAEEYVSDCLKSEEFPNLAGFARRMRIGVERFHAIGEQYPEEYDATLAVLEDGALNAEHIPGKSALLTVDYFRRRLHYRDGEERHRESHEEGTVELIFAHDIAEDGK